LFLDRLYPLPLLIKVKDNLADSPNALFGQVRPFSIPPSVRSSI
jgi:hypothetical protein